MLKHIETNSEEQTRAFAAELIKASVPGTVIALHGDLGAGKTVFARGAARALGIQSPVTSPTYTIISEYPLEDGKFLFHLDLYRIDNSESALAFGVDEYLEEPSAYILVEWPERISPLLPRDTVHVRIEHAGENKRLITVDNAQKTAPSEMSSV